MTIRLREQNGLAEKENIGIEENKMFALKHQWKLICLCDFGYEFMCDDICVGLAACEEHYSRTGEYQNSM